tara:strand:- start:36 stop:1898 length:1863 start_codon:yes stop_codon:yes gene_type:complete
MFKAEVEWNSPEEFKDLSKYPYIAIDLETKDPHLKSKGSGSIVGDGEIVGIAVAVEGWSGYYSFGHQQGNFFDERSVMRWIKDVCALPCTKIFHNAMYDVCWLRSYGVKINGHIIDTMVMASLLDENRQSYSLNALSYLELGETKEESVLKDIADRSGVDSKAELWKLPAMAVGAYAEKDAELTLKLFKLFSQKIKNEKLEQIFNLETQLFPCLVDMRFLGVRVDVEGAHKLKQQLAAEEKELLQKIKRETQVDVQIWAARSIAQVFEKLHLPYKRTEKTNSPSFTKNFLSTHTNPVVKHIAKAREINKAHTTFIDTIIKYQHKGRIHADINPIRSDSGGTITGRFSYSNPNLQQIPARNKQLGPLIRSLFIPERDHTWGCFDYSQQEPRLVVHFAAESEAINNDSVKDIVSRFKENKVDFHRVVADMADIPREQAKTINLGLFYGMGKAKLQAELGLETREEAEKLFEKYHNSVPFVQDLMNSTSRDASNKGEIQTILGRVCRFDKWEESAYTPGRLKVPMTWEEAHSKYGDRIRRAFTYKALNKLIQGSAADMTKKAMLDLYNEKIIPHIQIHDELDLSVESDKQAKKIIDIMQNAVKLHIPNKVDYESGKNWGDIYD